MLSINWLSYVTPVPKVYPIPYVKKVRMVKVIPSESCSSYQAPITAQDRARDDQQLREISHLLIFVTKNSSNHINQLLNLGLWEGFKKAQKAKKGRCDIYKSTFWGQTNLVPVDSSPF